MPASPLSTLTRGAVAPETIHRGTQELPFVSTVPGISSQLVHVNLETGLWVTRARFSPGYKSVRHYHHGEVFAFTIKGRWRYLEQKEINDAGSYLYEPAGAVHTQYVLEDNPEPADIWFSVLGRNDDLDDAGNVIGNYGAPEILENYINACREAGFGTPPVIGI